MDHDLVRIARQFNIQGTIKDIQPFGNGHINDTYLVSTIEENLPDYILQRKNHAVFKDIPGMMENIIRVTSHIKSKLESKKNPDSKQDAVCHIKTNDGNYFYKDQVGNFWVVFLFIGGCKSYEKIDNPVQAYLAGKAFGQFQNQLADLPGKPLNETIAKFHNIEFRLNNFEKARKVNFENRCESTSDEITFALALSEEMRTLLDSLRCGKLPLRITHNDTKINNILFDRDDNIRCVIDLDTVMPGLVHYDFGDAIRTAANTADEDETNLSLISVNMEIFDAFTKGFLGELKDILTPEEKKLLAHAAKFMAYIMGLRFLTDYLEGDVYYKIKHKYHNIERARAQFKLVREIESQMGNMNKIVALYS